MSGVSPKPGVEIGTASACNGWVAQHLPDPIQLTRAEAFQVAGAIDAAVGLLEETTWLGIVLELEVASENPDQQALPERGGIAWRP